VLGVINLRGAVVPILDLRRRLGLGAVEFGKTTVIIVVRVSNGAGGERTVGMVVDAVSEVYNIATADTRPPPDVCGNVNTVFVKSLATIQDRMLMLLDMERLIGDSIADKQLSGAAA